MCIYYISGPYYSSMILHLNTLSVLQILYVKFLWSVYDRVQDSHEEQEFCMTRLDWVGIRLNQFEMF